MYLLATLSSLVGFVPEVRSLSVAACGWGRCRCARCRAYMQRRKSFIDRQKSYLSVRVPARQSRAYHVGKTHTIYIKVPREKF